MVHSDATQAQNVTVTPSIFSKNLKEIVKLCFFCGVVWLMIQGGLNNGSAGIYFISLLIGLLLYAAYGEGIAKK
ncbi:MAG: hypothetical protein JWN18_400 [Parcubacteria group bacterium]|nr:hypothetical protein [Parcubacteria group bacterium]